MRVHRNSRYWEPPALPSSAERRIPRAPARTAVFVAVMIGFGSCSRSSFDLGEEDDPASPASSTFQLAPAAPGSTSASPDDIGSGHVGSGEVGSEHPGQGSPGRTGPGRGPVGNVLAATAHDATPPGSAGVTAPSTARAAASLDGAPSATCIKGWVTPPRGSPLRSAVLDMMRVRPGERFVVDEMRYFVGPEDAEVVGREREVERWYVKASTETEPRRRQRWLVRRARVGNGVDAIAPYDSTGYGPRTWRRPDASDQRFADPFERPCQGTKPGEKCMGLPREVLGCLAGT